MLVVVSSGVKPSLECVCVWGGAAEGEGAVGFKPWSYTDHYVVATQGERGH